MYVFAKTWVVLIMGLMFGLGVLGFKLMQPSPVHMGYEVKEHFIDYRPKYNFDDCRIWIDYSPQRIAPQFDKRAAYIVRDTIAAFDKYMVYLSWSDHGGSPGIHLYFLDHCEKRDKAAQKIARALVREHPDIRMAHVVPHSQERSHLDIGPPLFMEFFKDHAPPLPQKP